MSEEKRSDEKGERAREAERDRYGHTQADHDAAGACIRRPETPRDVEGRPICPMCEVPLGVHWWRCVDPDSELELAAAVRVLADEFDRTYTAAGVTLGSVASRLRSVVDGAS